MTQSPSLPPSDPSEPASKPAPANKETEFDFAPLGFHSVSAGRTIDIVRFVISIWKPLAVGGMVGVLLGIAAYLYLGPVYTAGTQVLVSKKASVPINDGEANRYGDRGDHVHLIQTDLIVERAFENHGLDEIPELAGAYDPLQDVVDGLRVQRSAGRESSFDNILSVEFTHPDKEIAKVVVQAIVDSYREYLSETREENATELYRVLLKQAEDAATRIQELEAEYKSFRDNSPVFLNASPVVTVNGVPTAAQSPFEARLASIDKAKNDLVQRRAAIRAKIGTLDKMVANNVDREVIEFWIVNSMSTGDGKGGGGGAGITTATSPVPQKADLDQQLMDARLLERRLLHVLGENHTNIRNLRRQIDMLLGFYREQGLTPPKLDRDDSGDVPQSADLVTVFRQMLNEQLLELDFQEKDLNVQYGVAIDEAKAASMFEIEDQRFKDEISRQKQQHKQILDQIAAYDVSREQEGYRVKQIAQVRVSRSLMRVIKIVGAFGVLGVVAVFCLAYFREWYDTTLKTVDEVKHVTKLGILGNVPLFEEESASSDERVAGLAPSLRYVHAPGSRDAEAFRSIRTTLLFGVKDGNRVVQLTSSQPGDGKSTVAANLAIAIAQSGKKVLLIDADMRRPTLHGLLGLNQEIGLAEVLLGEIEWENAIQPTSISGLTLLAAGTAPANPAELLSADKLAPLMEAARAEFDLILIDTPPVLAVSDPCIVSPYADAAMLVVRMAKNNRKTVERSLDLLRSHGVRLAGVVVNGLSTSGDVEGIDYESYACYYTPAPEPVSRPRTEVALPQAPKAKPQPVSIHDD